MKNGRKSAPTAKSQITDLSFDENVAPFLDMLPNVFWKLAPNGLVLAANLASEELIGF